MPETFEIPTPWDEEIAANEGRGDSMRLNALLLRQDAYLRGWMDAMKQQAKANERYLGDLEDAGIEGER